MRIEFTLPTKAFSLNKYRYGHTPHKTVEARAYEEAVLGLLEREEGISDIGHQWRLSGGYVHIELVAVYPREVFYNKQGMVSAKTLDVTNFEKILQDLIMNKTMLVDDRFVTRLVSSKCPGSQYEIRVVLQLVPNP